MIFVKFSLDNNLHRDKIKNKLNIKFHSMPVYDEK